MCGKYTGLKPHTGCLWTCPKTRECTHSLTWWERRGLQSCHTHSKWSRYISYLLMDFKAPWVIKPIVNLKSGVYGYCVFCLPCCPYKILLKIFERHWFEGWLLIVSRMGNAKEMTFQSPKKCLKFTSGHMWRREDEKLINCVGRCWQRECRGDLRRDVTAPFAQTTPVCHPESIV